MSASEQPINPSDLKLPISELFVSLQGEGKLTGVPSAFIRVAGCNMRCVWCDTPEASWAPKGENQTIGDVLAWVRATGVRHAVLTGGEPMLFDAVGPLAQALKEQGMHLTIETAGTINRDWPIDLLSLSPKLENSTPTGDPRDPDGKLAVRHEHVRCNLTPMRQLVRSAQARGIAVQLKFVVSMQGDLGEIETLLDRLGSEIASENVLLMPEGVATPEPERVAWVARACIERGWRYAHRLHIELFGNTRGT